LLDLLYAKAVAARRRWFERHPEARRRLRRPVISVGNLSVGGTGKTPLVARIAQWLVDCGERPAILSRGYGRRDRRDGVVVVSRGEGPDGWLADLDRAGDEPLMLARVVPRAIVAVADDRFLAGVVAERRLGATVHVLDDGFQHVQLARDCDVLLTRPGEISGGRTLPFGRLRESLDAAARADFVVVLDADPATAKAEAWTLGVSQVSSGRRMIAPPPGEIEGPPPRPSGRFGEVSAKLAGPSPRATADAEGRAGAAVAVAGIAQPQQFFQMLTDAGYNVARCITFPDHHRYGHSDIARIREATRAAATDVVLTTEKDQIRFEAAAASSVTSGSPGDLPFRCVAVPMTLEIDDWDALRRCITAAIQRADS
jgi:tetraacyldisaccharide 4'-kinase